MRDILKVHRKMCTVSKPLQCPIRHDCKWAGRNAQWSRGHPELWRSGNGDVLVKECKGLIILVISSGGLPLTVLCQVLKRLDLL